MSATEMQETEVEQTEIPLETSEESVEVELKDNAIEVEEPKEEPKETASEQEQEQYGKAVQKRINKSILDTVKKKDFILGHNVNKFEKKFSILSKSKYAVGCATGTDALILALKSLNLKPNFLIMLSIQYFGYLRKQCFRFFF